jgi:hypothetical protein
MSDGEAKRYAYMLLAQLDAITTHEIEHSTALLTLCAAFGDEKRRLRPERSLHPHRLFLYERAVDLKFVTGDLASDARLAYALRTLGYAVTVANTIQPSDARGLRGKLIRFVNSVELVFSAAQDGVACQQTVRRQLDPYLEAFQRIRPLLQTLSCWSRGRLLPPETAPLPDSLPEDGQEDHLAIAFPGLAHYFGVLRASPG